MKRILSLLLAVALVLTMLPTMTLRAEAKTGGKLVALTFDDGPSSKYTNQLLDGLKERGVPVTFFILGENAVNNRATVRRFFNEIVHSFGGAGIHVSNVVLVTVHTAFGDHLNPGDL